MKTRLLLLSLLLVSGLSFAQGGAKMPAPVQTSTKLATAAPQSVARPADTRMSEKDYYKMMYEQAKESASSANDLTRWTLESVGLVIALVLGAQVLFNYRLGKQELAAIRADIQAQVVTDIENRAKDIEARLTAGNNRELDNTKEALKQAISLVSRELQDEMALLAKEVDTFPMYVSANEYLARKDYPSALSAFLPFAEARIAANPSDTYLPYSGISYFANIDEIQEADYNRLVAIGKIIEVKNNSAYTGFWKWHLDRRPVYRMIHDERGAHVKQYIQNAPIAPK